jgi:ribosomal protein L11 methyltransferase
VSEIRFYITTTEKRAETALSLMTDAFEEDGYAIATMEIDEKKDIWEASVYMFRVDEEEVHGRFVVHGSHDRGTERAGEIAIEIDAGQAFGTGHHGTTAGCLETIFSVMRARTVRRVLDLGTGSGVLAIAARKLAPVRVLATDIDPVATRVARENVRLNGIAEGIALETAPGFHSTAFRRHGPFDLIIANILARPLMRMAPQLAAQLAPGGDVILSGILASQRWKVLAAYNGAGLRHVRTIWREGWVTIHLDNRR